MINSLNTATFKVENFILRITIKDTLFIRFPQFPYVSENLFQETVNINHNLFKYPSCRRK